MKVIELKQLVDKGRGIKDKMDSLEAELNKIKKTLREEAKSKKVGFFVGEKHFCRVGPMSSTECEAGTLYDTFMELGRAAEFWECIKVLVTDAKAALGETVFNSISTTQSEPYKKVSFLAKIPKKYIE